MQENRSIAPGLGAFRLTLQSRENGFCGYVYSAPNFSFEELPDNWVCPVCKMPKKAFVRRN